MHDEAVSTSFDFSRKKIFFRTPNCQPPSELPQWCGVCRVSIIRKCRCGGGTFLRVSSQQICLQGPSPGVDLGGDCPDASEKNRREVWRAKRFLRRFKQAEREGFSGNLSRKPFIVGWSLAPVATPWDLRSLSVPSGLSVAGSSFSEECTESKNTRVCWAKWASFERGPALSVDPGNVERGRTSWLLAGV